MSEIFVEHTAGEYDSETTMQICCMCGVMLKRPNSTRISLRPGLKILMDRMEIGMIFDMSSVIEGDRIINCYDRTVRIVEETQNHGENE